MNLVLIALLSLAPTSHSAEIRYDAELGRALAVIEYHDYRVRAAHRSWMTAGGLTIASAGLGAGSRWVRSRLPVQIFAASLLVPAVNMILLGLRASSREVGGKPSWDRFRRFEADRRMLRPWRDFLSRSPSEQYEIALTNEPLRQNLIELATLLEVWPARSATMP